MAGKALESLEDLKTLLDGAKTIAVVGLSDKPDRESHAIAAYLQRNGYRIVGVNPTAARILGEPCYPSLAAIPEDTRKRIDLVAVFRRPEDAVKVAEEAAGLGLERVWFVPGSFSREALAAADRHGLTFVAERCIRTAHEMTRTGDGS
jgi:predicted CoA-binding protein